MSPGHWFGVLLILTAAILLPLVLQRRGGQRWRSFAAHPSAVPAIGWLTFMVGLAIFAPQLAPYRPSRQLDIVAMMNLPPSWHHPLGTDLYSRDIWSRILYGARVSLGTGALATLVALLVGTTVGLCAGYFRRWDAILMRLVDIGLAIPRIFVVLVLTATWQHLNLAALILLLGLTGWFGTSRLVRSHVLLLREAPFVQSARAMGGGARRIILHHILPNVLAPVIVSAALGIGSVMLAEAALSFLGVGVQPPTASWGNMIADGRDQLTTAPWTTIFPGLAIAMAVMSLNAIADGLRSVFDPRESSFR